MKRRNREIWREGQEGYDDGSVSGPAPKRRRDTDLSEPSVRKSRRQLRREEEAADAAESTVEMAGRAPWDDPAEDSDFTFASAAAAQSSTPHRPASAQSAPVTATAPASAAPGGSEPSGAPEEESKKSRTNTLASVLSGNILSQSEVRRAYPYLIFVACLMFLYIANIFRTQYIYRQHSTLTEQVKELRAKSMTIASERMRATQQSNIMVELERRRIPLKESLAPNKVIPNPARYGEEKDDR